MNENEIAVKTEKIEYKKYLFLIISRWYWVLMFCVAGLLVGYLVNRWAVHEYEVSMSMIFESDETPSFTDYIAPARFARRRKLPDLKNEITKMRSYTVTKRTLERLDFDVSYYAIGRMKESPLYLTNKIKVRPLGDENSERPIYITIVNDQKYNLKFEIGKNEIDTILFFDQEYNKYGYHFEVNNKSHKHDIKTYKCIINNIDHLVKQYQNRTRIRNDQDNEFKINLSLRGSVPEKMVKFLNTFANVYLEYSLEQKNEQNLNTLDFIEQQITLIEDSLSLIEKQLINFKLQQDVVDLDMESQLAFSKYQAYQSQKTNVQFRQKYYNYIKDRFEENTDPREIITLSMTGIDDPMLSALINDYEDVYKNQLASAGIVKKEIPGLWSYDSKLNDMKLLIMDKLDGVMESNDESLSWIDQEIAKAKNEIRSLPISETDFLKIDRTYQLYNKYYTFLLEKRAEGGIEKASQTSDSRILDIARVENTILLGLTRKKILLYGFMVGLVVPIASIILLGLFNRRIISKEDIINNTDIPILGLLGHNHIPSGIPVFEDPRSRLTESFRRIRTDMRFYLHDEGDKTILVTSAISGEGKTFVSINLALITAMANKKVLLMGMDLRKPSIHKMFNIENEKGISSYLIGRNKMEDIILHTNINNLDIAPSGPVPPNPVELMETERMQQFFEMANKKYDYIFIDTPPLAVVTDAQILSKYTSLCIFVLRQNYSHKEVFEYINAMNEQKKFKHLALLVNDMEPSRALGYRYSYGYSYSYGYGYGYRHNESYYKYKNTEEE